MGEENSPWELGDGIIISSISLGVVVVTILLLRHMWKEEVLNTSIAIPGKKFHARLIFAASHSLVPLIMGIEVGKKKDAEDFTCLETNIVHNLVMIPQIVADMSLYRARMGRHVHGNREATSQGEPGAQRAEVELPNRH